MNEEQDAIRLRIFIGESDRYENQPLYMYLLQWLKQEGLAGATVVRGIAGFGKTSHIHTASIMRLSSDLPIIVEVVDEIAKIEAIKKPLGQLLEGGLITEESIKLIYYESKPAREGD